eukprot:TRINITY_DN6906_c0_g1_i1.p1 TRINITY_DN6906_c0_g1~~TRINITY_DN6906_c0_g1_i1.p1  ORF type:complete len:1452 (+),score=580.75 TRINITY_DN6906_c0_g1_i1:46-4356(+)
MAKITVDKLGDAKVAAAAKEALAAFAENTSLNHVSLTMCAQLTKATSPKVIAAGLAYLGELIDAFGLDLNVKPVVAVIKKALANTNPSVRSAAIELIGVLHLHLGDPVQGLFKGEKQALLDQIATRCQANAGKEAPTPTAAQDDEDGTQDDDDDVDNAGDAEAGEASAAAVSSKPKRKAASKANLDDLVERSDLSQLLSADVIAQCGHSSWKERRDGLEAVGKVLAKHPHVKSEVGDVAPALAARLGDSNKNLITTTLEHLTVLAAAMGPKGESTLKAHWLGPMVGTLSDNKDTVRTTAVAALDAWAEQVGPAPMLPPFVKALSSGKPLGQTTALRWLHAQLNDIPKAELPVSELKPFVKPLLACLMDRNQDVRKAAQEFLVVMVRAFKRSVWAKVIQTRTGDNAALTTYVDKAIQEAGETANASTATAKAAKSAPKQAKASSSSSAKASSSSSAKSSSKSKSGPPSSSSAKGIKKPTRRRSVAAKVTTRHEEASSSSEAPLVMHPVSRFQRENQMKAHKLLRWDFDSPRADHINQLKDQLKQCVSESLFKLMFADDFNDRVKALDILTEACAQTSDTPPMYAAEGERCSDLLLQYTTLRFYETNPTETLRTVAFLEGFIRMLANRPDTSESAGPDAKFALTEMQGQAFVPYLVVRLGEKSDSLRRGVKAVLAQLLMVLPYSKIVGYLLECLKTKNSRLRAECLTEIAGLIAKHGITPIQNRLAKTAKKIGELISDRDSSVRNAALETVGVLHDVMGDKAVSLLGALNHKEADMLAQRLERRAKKNAESQPAVVSTPPSAPSTASLAPAATVTKAKAPAQMDVPKVDGPFHHEFPSIDSLVPTMPELFETPLDEDDSPLPSPDELRRHRSSSFTLTSTNSIVPTTTVVNGATMSQTISPTVISPAELHGQTITLSDQMQAVIDQVASTDMRAATVAIKQLYQGEEAIGMLTSRADKLVLALTNQLGVVEASYLDENARVSKEDRQSLVRSLFKLMLNLFTKEQFTTAVSVGPLTALCRVLIDIMLDPRVMQDPTMLGDCAVKSCNDTLFNIVTTGSCADVTIMALRLLKENTNVPKKATITARLFRNIINRLMVLTETDALSPQELTLMLAGVEDYFRKWMHVYQARDRKSNKTDEDRKNEPEALKAFRKSLAIVNLLVKTYGPKILAHCTRMGTQETSSGLELVIHIITLRFKNTTREELLAKVPIQALQTPSRTLSQRFNGDALPKPGTVSNNGEAEAQAGLPAAEAVFDSSNVEFAQAEAAASQEASQEANAPDMSEAQVQALVTESLAMIQDPDKSSQGWQQLRAFHVNHPQVDVLQYADGCSKLFKQLIKRRLEDASANASQVKLLAARSNVDIMKDLEIAKDKVMRLTRGSGVESAAVDSKDMSAGEAVAPEPVVQVPTVAAPVPKKNKPSDLDQLRKRLAELRNRNTTA